MRIYLPILGFKKIMKHTLRRAINFKNISCSFFKPVNINSNLKIQNASQKF